MRQNPLLFINAAVLPAVLLVITLGGQTAPPPHVLGERVWAVLLTSVWGATVWMAGGVLRRERRDGTLSRLVRGRHALFLVLVGKSLGATVYATLAIAAAGAVTLLALGLRPAFGDPVVIIIGLAVLLVSATTLGCLLSCLLLVTRHGLEWSSALVYPVFLLGGLLISADRLGPLEWLPRMLSLHWIQRVLATSASGGAADVGALAAAMALSGLYAVVGWAGVRWAVRKAREEAALDFI